MPKYAVMDNIENPRWQGHEEVSMQKLTPEDATWDVYKCHQGEFPDLETVDQYVGIFITGSPVSANDTEQEWIQKQKQWVTAFAGGQRPCKLIASCYGCQVVAAALGGKVGSNPSGDFVLTVETVQMTEALLQQPCYKEVAPHHHIANSFKIIQSHGEQVLALPEGAVLLGTSPTAPFEVWSYGSNILALQGHCEFDCATALSKIHTPLSASGRLSSEQSQASAQALKSIPPDDDFVIAMIKHWWHPAAAAAREADQRSSTQGQLQAPLDAAKVGQAQGQQPFEALTAGNPQAAAIDQITEKLLTQREHLQQSSQQSPQSVTTYLHPNQPEGTLQQRPQGTCQEPSFAGLKGSSHAASGDDVQHQGPSGNEQHGVDQSNHPMQLTGAEAAEAAPQPRTEPTAETVNTGPHPSLPPACHTSSSSTIDAPQHPVADASAGWQHHNQLVDPYTRAFGSTSPRKAPTESLLGWTEQMQQSEDQLMEKAQVLLKELAAVVDAETGRAMSDYVLLKDMNQVAETKYAGMLQQVEALQPALQELCVCREAAQPVIEAISKLEASMDTIELVVLELESESKHLSDHLKLSASQVNS